MKSGGVRERSRSGGRGTQSSMPSSSTPGSSHGDARMALRRPRWLVLRSSLEENFGIDCWNLRKEPLSSAAVIGTLPMEQAFQVVGEVEGGEWLKVNVQKQDGQQLSAFVARYFDDPNSTARLEAFVPSGAPELCDPPVTPPKPAGVTAVEVIEQALQKLVSLRQRYEQLTASQRDVNRAQISRRIERVMQELDFLGVPYEQVLNCQDPLTFLLRGSSFPHRYFSNPLAETCWLSCLFQSLWHSRVFHAAFDLYLAPSKCTPAPTEKVLTALQRTWANYKEEAVEDGTDELLSLLEAPEAPRLIPSQDLVEGFGEGYGDMSEALASIQNELSDSSNPAARKISELIVLIPLSTLDGSWPMPAGAWKQAQEWKVTEAPIIAVDLSLPEITLASSRDLAKRWIPRTGSGSAGGGDLSSSHRMVALVCYMWNLRHYVTFCRRQRDDTSCLFFNDLPGLTHGAPEDVQWQDIPNMCYNYGLTPRLVLYESLGKAEEVVMNLRSSSVAADPQKEAAEQAGVRGDAQESREMCRQQ